MSTAARLAGRPKIGLIKRGEQGAWRVPCFSLMAIFLFYPEVISRLFSSSYGPTRMLIANSQREGKLLDHSPE